MNSFQRICRSPAFLVLALILCAAVIAGGVALAPAAPKVWIVIPVLLAVAAVICFFVARSTSKAALQKKKEAENEGVVKADLDHAGASPPIFWLRWAVRPMCKKPAAVPHGCASS